MTAPDQATLRQHQAASPDLSTWLSANAGSGKTRVLTDRVARLLVQGVDPQNILCLTYTKAAAAEMQNRLLARLGAWAMLDDGALEKALSGIGAGIPEDLRQARTLFARALEAPGGLKIQTIHAFCAAILRRFPLEAGVPPQFTEIDEDQTRALLDEVLEAMAAGPDAGVIDAVAPYLRSESLEDLGREVLSAREGFGGSMTRDAALALFGLPPGFDEAAMTRAAFSAGDSALLASLRPVLASGGATDLKAAEKVGALLGRPLSAGDLPLLEDILLFGESAAVPFGSKAGRFPTKACRAALGFRAAELDSLMDRVAAARPLRLGLDAAERTCALHAFADRLLPAYDAAKAARGWLDFDDLIVRTRDLLVDAPAAAWVLYKLDGRIDHILVDEAQDTSPVQWKVIEALAEEIASGSGSRPQVRRTLFVVGDKKQSIYSFQGARPEAFDDMQARFEQRLASIGGLQRLQLQYSFRSSAAVLSAVDRTYLDGTGREQERHEAFHAGLPGRVDLWPILPPESSEDPDAWWNPVDLQGADHHNVRLAESIADFIRDCIAGETLPLRDGTRRPIHAGDFLVLVQRRTSGLFHTIIHACKSRGIPIAGADRLRLAAELAVRDVLSVLRFLALPEDDLALAEALRSPLLGWSEDDLFRLAHGREGYLWTALRRARNEHPATFAFLDPLMAKADYLRPYELIEEILTTLWGRERLIARMGPEIEDGLDALLSQALRYESLEIPSLTGFLAWHDAGDIDIKRQAESAGRQMRVMTVHGAKGLEAPVVILPDTLRGERERPSEILMGSGTALWRTPAAASPPAIIEARRIAAEAERAERRRLLYVAMTRAEQWLVVCGAGDLKDGGATWYDEVERGLTEAGAVPHPMPTGEGLRLSHGNWSDGPVRTVVAPERGPEPLKGWMRSPAIKPERPPQPLKPSDLGGAKVLPGEGGEGDPDAMERGTIFHALLDHLSRHPAALREGIARAVLDELGLPLADSEGSALVSSAMHLLADPALAEVFGPDTLSEVPISGSLSALAGRAISGTIDRLIVRPDSVLAVDYKTNRVVPGRPEDVPEGLLRQLGAYAALLAQVYPGRRIETALLWTATGHLMSLPHEMVMDALRRTATS
jgi:ATP-dependent helicase/nuclease subunit A